MLLRFLFSALLTACFTSAALYAQQDVPKNLAPVLKQLGIDPKECYEALVVEKVLPYAKNQSVLVIPIIAAQEEGFMSFDSYIVLLDHEHGTIRSTYYEADAWSTSVDILERITIDTAPYSLNTKSRAFGIRVRYSGSSRPNPYTDEYLSLFIPEGNKLVRVLTDFKVFAFYGEWDTFCEGFFTTEEKVVVLSSQQTNSFNDLIIKSAITSTRQVSSGDDCLDEEKKSAQVQRLRFRGGKYE